MSTRRNSAKASKKSKRKSINSMSNGSATPTAVSSSLDTIVIAPRTPRTPRPPTGGYWDSDAIHDEDSDDVQLHLLGGEARSQAGFEDEGDYPKGTKKGLTARDKQGMVLLCVLYLIQGVPLGLALGSIPFILREHLSYSQLATFALSSYPYSLKLLWSPIVDSLFFKTIGRRKSWIIPMQVVVGTLMLYISLNVQKLMDDPGKHLTELTVVFVSLVFFSATQDIAVDGWALTLLSQDNLSYASTCQTIGLNTGYFASFTVFLALNSEAFSKKWGIPRLMLGDYMKFWAIMSYLVSAWLLLFKKEDKESNEDAPMSLMAVYKSMWSICKLKHVQLLIMLHFFVKLGFAGHDAFSLKLVEKGLKREDLAIVVLIDFPFQILSGWFAAGWSRGDKPLRPWIYMFWPRLGFCLITTGIVYFFPKPPLTYWFFLFLIGTNVLSGLTGTIQFVGISAFHNRISDPVIGGTYMTLLNTFSNLGGTWPKWFVLKSIDLFTVATCTVQKSALEVSLKAAECVSEHGKQACTALGGTCVTETDGYYIVSAVTVTFGVLFLLFVTIPTANKLQSLPTNVWRVKLS